MTKLVAILFSTLILFQSSNISFDDLSKLHNLLEHAKFHEATYGDSFIDFLVEHYDDSKGQHDLIMKNTKIYHLNIINSVHISPTILL